MLFDDSNYEDKVTYVVFFFSLNLPPQDLSNKHAWVIVTCNQLFLLRLL